MKWADLPDVLVFERRFKAGPRCRHNRTAIDARARALWCQDCGVDLDPIDLLARYSSDQSKLRQRMAAERPEMWELVEAHVQAGGRISIGQRGVTATRKLGGRDISRKGQGFAGLADALVDAIRSINDAARWEKA